MYGTLANKSFHQKVFARIISFSNLMASTNRLLNWWDSSDALAQRIQEVLVKNQPNLRSTGLRWSTWNATWEEEHRKQFCPVIQITSIVPGVRLQAFERLLQVQRHFIKMIHLMPRIRLRIWIAIVCQALSSGNCLGAKQQIVSSHRLWPFKCSV